MPLVSMGPMLRRARSEGFGVAAYNMIDYNSARSIVDGAAELNAPVIVQVSVKTVKYWGAKEVGAWVATMAGNVDTPVALHLDHCTDVDVIKMCIDAGWTAVMFDGSSLPFEQNLQKSKQVYELTQAAGVGMEAEIGAIGGVEDDKVVSDEAAMLADLTECVEFCRELPNLDVFAPAIGTAHGFYRGEAKIDFGLLQSISEAVKVPIALHGGTGLTPDQFHKCISLGAAKVNISTGHKQLFIDGFCGVKATSPSLGEPIPYVEAQYQTMKADVKGSIKLFGSNGTASGARQ